MRRLVDANVIIRYLLGDISAQAEKARNEINRGTPRTAAARIPHSIIRLFDYSIISLFALLLLAPMSLFGRELDFRGQKVTVEGAPIRGEEGK